MMIKRLLPVLFVFLLLLALPFFLRRDQEEKAPEKSVENAATDQVVVISAHNKSFRDECAAKFKVYYREKFGRDVEIDFRSPGGTSDIIRYIADRYKTEFRRYYEKNPVLGEWDSELAGAFADPKSDLPTASERAKKIRRIFLDSKVGIGIDVFAGGGVFEHERQKKRGFAADAGVASRHPELFTDAVIPKEYGGSPLYDAKGKYYSVVLSTFGVCCNLDRLAEMKNSAPPRRWSDLADPRFFASLSCADPTKSGSVNKCFEIIIQQAMAEAGNPSDGWRNGVNIIRRMFANCRNIGESAVVIVQDVSSGNSTAGIAIDSYALSEIAYQAKQLGMSRICYLTPQGGTAVSGDPVQLLRGAANRQAALAFIDFLLSEAGQKMHAYRPGTPGGPEIYAINRPPVRRDIYDENYRRYASFPDYDPYKSGADFAYHAEWTEKYYSLIRQLIKSIMLDCHEELTRAWRKIIAAGGPDAVPEAMIYFEQLPFDYAHADAAARSITIHAGNSALEVAETLRKWSNQATENYRRAGAIADRKRQELQK